MVINRNKDYHILFVVLLFNLTFSNYCFSQNRSFNFSLSNSITALPVTAIPLVFYSQLHPGVEVSKNWKINDNVKNSFFLKANSGFYYHRFVQTLVWAYPSFQYERKINNRLGATTGLGIGYAFSIEGSDVFKINNSGQYEKINKLAGRSQFIAQLELGAKYSLQKNNPEGLKLLLSFKSYLQGTYVKSYVPLLPLNSVLLGISIPLNNKQNEK